MFSSILHFALELATLIGCKFFRTCNNEAQVCMAFIEILLCLYLNMTKNIYDLLTKKYEHQYCLEFFHEECFSHAYRLMDRFLCRTQPIIYLKIYSNFFPMKDYESRCFKIINSHCLKFISEKGKEKNKAKNAH